MSTCGRALATGLSICNIAYSTRTMAAHRFQRALINISITVHTSPATLAITAIVAHQILGNVMIILSVTISKLLSSVCHVRDLTSTDMTSSINARVTGTVIMICLTLISIEPLFTMAGVTSNHILMGAEHHHHSLVSTILCVCAFVCV